MTAYWRSNSAVGGLRVALLDHDPAAHRLAVGLCGTGGVADAVAARVLERAAAAAGRWASAEAAGRWFTRYTVLTARRPVLDASAAWRGDLAWLGGLPQQQREAFVLHHGLGLDLYRMAAAMDCSTRAASNHLVAATAALRSAGALGDRAAGLAAALAAVVPPPPALSADVARVVRGRRWRTVPWRAARLTLKIGVPAGLGWAGWHLWKVLVF